MWTIHALSLPEDQEIKHLVIWSSGHLVIDWEIGTLDE